MDKYQLNRYDKTPGTQLFIWIRRENFEGFFWVKIRQEIVVLGPIFHCLGDNFKKMSIFGQNLVF